MRIAMMGSGGVGGYFGGRMAAAGYDVTFIARGRHLDAIRANGLKIDSRDLGDALVSLASVSDDPAEVGPVDYVVIGVKLWDTAAVGDAILPMLGPKTTVVSLQNGVECDEILEGIVGSERLIGGVAFIASSVSEPGVIKHIGTMQRVALGERAGGTSSRVDALTKALLDGGVNAEASQDIERVIWEKFVFLVGLSATTTSLRLTLGPIRKDPKHRKMLLGAMRETVAVARVRGIDLPKDYADQRLEFVDGLPSDMTSSMHHDLNAGNPLEVAWLSGAVARLGEQVGVATPINASVATQLAPLAAPHS